MSWWNPIKSQEDQMKLTSLLVALVVVCGSSAAQAQGYPSRPITMIVPFPAGGPTDTLGRILAEGMRASLGQTIGRQRWCRQRGARVWALFPRKDQHPLSVRALSRRGACDAGFSWRPDRSDVCRGVTNADLCAQRQDEGLCRHGSEPLAGFARSPDHG